MGADLYIEVIYDETQKKYESKFDKAVEERNAIILSDTIRSQIRGMVEHDTDPWTDPKPIPANLEHDTDPWTDPKPIPANLKLGSKLEPWRDDYNRFVAAQKKVSRYYELMNSQGYFRDSYNFTSVFWRLGLSWWQDLDRFATNNKLHPAGAKRLLSLVKKTPLKPVTQEELKKAGATESVARWNKYFVNRKKSFIKFLELAIKSNKTILCSC